MNVATEVATATSHAALISDDFGSRTTYTRHARYLYLPKEKFVKNENEEVSALLRL